jgi:hypothetical protein
LAALWAASVALLAACSSSGDSESPPGGVKAAPEDSRALISWDARGGVDYWLFSASNPTLTTTNWLNFADGRTIINAIQPNYVCGLANGTTYYFTLNARTGDAGGGAGSPLVNATPRSAGESWTAGAALGVDLAALGFVPLTTCISNRAPTGTWVAVGPGAKIYSTGGVKPGAWTERAAPAGFSADLHGVAGRNNGVNTTASILFVAVGAGGAALTSGNGSDWAVGRAFDAAQPALRAVAYVGTFLAVGDGGIIRTSNDGASWTERSSGTTRALRAVTAGSGISVAVGDGGTVVTSSDAGVTWTARSFPDAGNLVGIAYSNSGSIDTFVAIGADGATLVSSNGGDSWTVRRIADGFSPRGIAVTSTFAVVTAEGSVYRSTAGLAWLGPVASGTIGLQAVTADGYGFAAVGAAGVNTQSY